MCLLEYFFSSVVVEQTYDSPVNDMPTLNMIDSAGRLSY